MCTTGSDEAAEGGVSIQGNRTIVVGSEQVNECVGRAALLSHITGIENDSRVVECRRSGGSLRIEYVGTLGGSRDC